ncbi:aminotransferase class I/II-fold pyridoxal phosphate-dependent enzyme [uncultured Roseibium sp.]|uniref:trans-sulfuration enzyme family protein n=1 Tax=uncultured Roseibium sp. TaxID=1936171 RepID=UPI00259840F8|nr:aminotransferase class I/II-fold pyridoxal phosphate-dependent enzyme [uncultured Roseibium sp.]
MKLDNRSAATIALHADEEFRADHAIAPPICQSVTYLADGPDDFARKAVEPHNAEFYGRHGNPTAKRLAKIVADLEGAEAGMVLSSGMGAMTTAILTFVGQGDHIIAQDGHYSATSNFLRKVLPRYGIETTFVDQTKPNAFGEAIRPQTKLILVETPVNPLATLTDLKAVANMARAAEVLTLCDNTFASPINQRPLEFGIDLVVHSATKYIGGHHDLLAGVVVGKQPQLDAIWDMSMDLGPIGAPFDAWLALRGLRTLKARIDVHNANAMKIATFLESHSAVGEVYYPGLLTHPQHELAKQQMTGFGGMLTFDLKGGYEAGLQFVSRLQLCLNAASLGGVETLVVQPAVMFRARLTDEQIRAQGVTPGMIRMSAGIEDGDDLVADLDQALSVI